MKRLLILLALLLGAGICSFAQVQMFQETKKIDKDGVVSRVSGIQRYVITGSEIYRVNEQGNRYNNMLGNRWGYKYKTTKNGNKYYFRYNNQMVMDMNRMMAGIVPYDDVIDDSEYIILSSDGERINHVYVYNDGSTTTTVLVKTSQEKIDKAKSDALEDLVY